MPDGWSSVDGWQMGDRWVLDELPNLDGWWMRVGWVSYEPSLSHRRKNFSKSIAHADVSMEHRENFVF